MKSITPQRVFFRIFWNLLLLVKFCASFAIPLTMNTVTVKLLAALQQDIPTIWAYKDIYRNRRALMLDQGLIDRAKRHISESNRLKNVFSLAEQGLNIDLSVVGGSISRGQPFVQKGLGKRVYFKALQDWWGKVVQPITGSKMIVRDLSIGGVGSEYFANCLPTHQSRESKTNLVLWELSGNDVDKYKQDETNSSQPLEQFLRNTLKYRTQPEILLLNFFNGHDFISKRGCHDLDSEGELEVAKHYDVTELSWSKAICPYLVRDQSGMAFEYLFAKDYYHPSVAAHAQMAYLLIEHIRDQFVYELSKGNLDHNVKIRNVLPYPIFDQTYTGVPLCYTLLKVDESEPLNTLQVNIISSPKYSFTTYRSFVNRGDKLQGLQTVSPNQLIKFRFVVPSYAALKPFKKLSLLSFTDSGEAMAQLDSRATVPLRTDQYSAIGGIETIPARNIGPGEHELRVWSKKGGFLILALMLG